MNRFAISSSLHGVLPVLFLLVAGSLFVVSCSSSPEPSTGQAGALHATYNSDSTRVTASQEEWKRVLAPKVFEVTRMKGTEQAYTGKYWDHHEAGTYCCFCCGQEVFSSEAKFESGTGWPSYFRPIRAKAVKIVEDRSYGIRQEVQCARCDAHLGHVFDDGPPTTGKRYCINSISLLFKEQKERALSN